MTQPPRDRAPRGRGPARRSRQRPSERGATTDQARLAAYTVLRAVADGAYANLELPAELRKRRLTGRDAAFATELTYSAIRMRRCYDAIIAVAADRPIERLDDAVLDTLRLGAHQLLGMRVPAHAAVDETVGLARKVNGAGASGLVNAVMRRISEADLDTWLARITPAEAPEAARLALSTSHPDWIVAALRQALLGHGRATAATVAGELAALLASDNAASQVELVARPGLVTVAELAAAGASANPHVATAARLAAGDPGAIAAVREGRAAVQDAGSQVVALVAASAPSAGGPRPGERWLDLCAGPGGKAGLLAALAIERGATLVANEVSPHRSDLVRATLRPAMALAPGVVEVRTADGRDIGGEEPAAYDRVLVDAPCTGLGALRRRPEARWRRTPADLAELGRLQRALLASGLDALAPGGVLTYATCSPHLAETTFVVADVLKKRTDIEQLDARPVVAGVTSGWSESLGAGPGVQLWPHVHGTDGMFLALLRKRPA